MKGLSFRFVPAAALAVAALLTAHPCLAQAPAIVAPAADAGLWSAINPWLADGAATLVTAAVAWAVVQFSRVSGIRITAAQEERVRQTALTGIYKAMHEAEVTIESKITPAVRRQIISDGVTWVMQRLGGAGGALAGLGFGQDIVEAIVIKMLGSAVSPVIDLGDIGRTLGGGGPAPVESPAMARASGPGLMDRGAAVPRG